MTGDTPLFKRILVVDDEAEIRRLLELIFQRESLEVVSAATAHAAIEELERAPFDVMLCDVRMPEMSGLDLLERAQANYPMMVVIMMSAFSSIDTALAAIKRGAYDYLAKPFKSTEVMLMIRKAEERERLRRENQQLKADLSRLRRDAVSFEEMDGKSAQIQSIAKTIRKIAEYKTTVLVLGESGTGKELVARAIHRLSSRVDQPFVAVNCGAIPENLLESELFGHKKGAFTDALRDKKGLVEEAHRGTLFLDEIGELPLPLQVKLLRMLQEEEIRPLGASKNQQVDVRIIAATARNLAKEVEAGRFREDLFYRLNVLPIELPPLRDRTDDIPMLIEHFISRTNARLGTAIRGVNADAMKLMMEYRWPGNVRELENTIEHAMVLAEGETIQVESLPIKLREEQHRIQHVLSSTTMSIKKATRYIEEELIRRALRETKGNRTSAAKLLEISHRALLYKLKEYRIEDL